MRVERLRGADGGRLGPNRSLQRRRDQRANQRGASAPGGHDIGGHLLQLQQRIERHRPAGSNAPAGSGVQAVPSQ